MGAGCLLRFVARPFALACCSRLESRGERVIIPAGKDRKRRKGPEVSSMRQVLPAQRASQPAALCVLALLLQRCSAMSIVSSLVPSFPRSLPLSSRCSLPLCVCCLTFSPLPFLVFVRLLLWLSQLADSSIQRVLSSLSVVNTGVRASSLLRCLSPCR